MSLPSPDARPRTERDRADDHIACSERWLDMASNDVDTTRAQLYAELAGAHASLAGVLTARDMQRSSERLAREAAANGPGMPRRAGW